MTDTPTSAWNVKGFLQVLFETATGPSWQDTQGVCLAPVSSVEVGRTGQGRSCPWRPCALSSE
jgi:hypothetical protein